MNIAIVDDIAAERALLRSRLERQLSRRNIQANLLEYDTGEAFLSSCAKLQFAVLFLDIYMDGVNGIETAKQFRSMDTHCLLIFTTTSTDHALEGFRVRAMHYLVKPYTEEMISDLIDEILARLPSTERYMTLKLNGTEVPLPFSSFIYAEHFSHMIHFHTTLDAVLTVRQSFRDFTAPLKTDERFFLCSRGSVVNLAHAVDFDGTVFQLDDGSRVSVSRDLSKSARQTFMKFLFEKEAKL